ncbi:glycerophosphodiester phosphodiesterase family protein [Rhodothermus marinus]|uniref:glycerophosphodiester phosphodiesterase family protein n=1 Tax=Rhodothermus marinus TaxID=29549 RepID=UPI0013749E38|nr:glycerophosphodiester phosphodiesterase family protein [Rhodothermus marinus]
METGFTETRVPPDILGHRGARGLRPENTWPAFARAIELGVDALEMDVVIAGDGTVVVSHEPWFSATLCREPSGRPVRPFRRYNLYRMTYAEIARFDCGSRRHPRFPQQEPVPAPKPRLEDVLRRAEVYAAELGRPPVRYSIEIKSRPEWEGKYQPDPETFVRRVQAVVAACGVTARTTLMSFDVRVLQVARRLFPELALSLLVEHHDRRPLADQLARLGFVPEVYGPDYRLITAKLVAEVHARGMRLIPWTVNRVRDMQRLLRLGVDGLITDYPDRALALLREA